MRIDLKTVVLQLLFSSQVILFIINWEENHELVFAGVKRLSTYEKKVMEQKIKKGIFDKLP